MCSCAHGFLETQQSLGSFLICRSAVLNITRLVSLIKCFEARPLGFPYKSLLGRRWCYRVLLQTYILRPSPSRFLKTEESNAVASSSRPAPNNDTANLIRYQRFIFPNHHSQTATAAASHPRTYWWNPNLFSVSSGLENGNAGSGMIAWDDNFRRLVVLLAFPTMDQRHREQVFISWFTRRSVSNAPRHPFALRGYQITTDALHW